MKRVMFDSCDPNKVWIYDLFEKNQEIRKLDVFNASPVVVISPETMEENKVYGKILKKRIDRLLEIERHGIYNDNLD